MEDKDIIISHETLFELLRIERSRTELQLLSVKYIEDVKKLLTDEQNAIELSVDENERQKRKSALSTTQKIINEIYERRERKIVNLAVIKSKTKSAIIDYTKFLDFEKQIFDEIVNLLDSHTDCFKAAISSSVVQKNPELLFSNTLDASVQKHESSPTMLEKQVSNLPLIDKKPEGNKTVSNENNSSSKIVRFLNSMPSFLGTELEKFGPYDEEEIVTLPTDIAQLLINKKRAQEIVIKD